jgi:predicted short-subunit dehydrogenase-like oxidoreductase (DUF2520 family)
VNRPRLGFIGIGTVGSALARALASSGYFVAAVHNRHPEKATRLAARLEGTSALDSAQAVVDACDLVLLTVPDDAIKPLADSITWTPAHRVVHCSGATSTDDLSHAAALGAAVGVFHPLQTLACAERAEENLAGSAFGIEASTESLADTLSQMARDLGGTPLVLSGEKAIYHASAVIASNYLVTLISLASGLWEKLGLTREEGLRALLPLVRGTVNNLEQIGLPHALTGPIARGDVGTIDRHLETLGRVAPELLAVYKELARQTIPIARAKGSLDEAGAERLSERLDKA